ncbi:BTB/POZ domain-containing protein NPY2 protein [Dioscorea alata]|uniref:BTB/POZ domain-containing protein NPY2 protein n=4 Tax=Dioscorea alata TaxID=55571 RepID=A0ACB7UX86_DIOAL|nr:BTB/POZ domain-containing protein NPY2 protein [Dioscorea alata]KAH7665348.1 BTB/POZ domain-containing protein NPY2 protein [Dioscorea alata]KAH7665349.1 BTB/POZ domain-containing protein NPY2 protein [Dioscorea alata]KAH7665350.1 BTB/POZ domain-containing protein NPY2 protein [Dioscorea alata]
MKFMKLGSRPDSFQKDGKNVRFVATDLATDIIIKVGDAKFYLHKFPLLSKCGLLQKTVTITDETCEEIDLSDIPGGPAAFEICAKFCYGMTVTLNAYNVIAARCAAEYLEMQESVEKGNIIYKIEVFLNTSILRSWKDSIIVLQSTKSFLSLAEDLKLVGHCADSIASKAVIETSMVNWSYTYNRKKLQSEDSAEAHWNGVVKEQSVPEDWWVEDLSELELDLYKRVIIAIKSKARMPNQVIGEALKTYMYKRLPSFSKGSMVHKDDVLKNKTMLETITWLLPKEKGAVTCGFLLKLLRLANLLNIGDMVKKDLIKRIGRQLEEGLVSDLLIPAPEGEKHRYDIEMVLSIVKEFVSQGCNDSQTSSLASTNTKLAVAKLVDGYLAEVAQDPNFPLSKFVDLAEMLSSESRPVHDALYRAIDMYLKEHPGMSKSEKKKICSLMDCKKLSAEASMHAVQNERLPLRVVVQVLFFEQVRSSVVSSGCRGSYGSSRSGATTNTEDEWDVIPRVEDLKPFKNTKLRTSASHRESNGNTETNTNKDDGNGGKSKGNATPGKMISKLWSSKGENCSSDTSESPVEEAKSTPAKNMRHSMS